MAQHSGGSYSSDKRETETWVYDADTGRKTYTSGSRAGQSEQIAPPKKFMTVGEENSSSNKPLIIIAVVGIIAAIVFARMRKSKTKQKDAK